MSIGDDKIAVVVIPPGTFYKKSAEEKSELFDDLRATPVITGLNRPMGMIWLDEIGHTDFMAPQMWHATLAKFGYENIRMRATIDVSL
jgi:hypothetical protein